MKKIDPLNLYAESARTPVELANNVSLLWAVPNKALSESYDRHWQGITLQNGER